MVKHLGGFDDRIKRSPEIKYEETMAYEARFTDIKIELMNEEIIYKDSPGRVIVFDRSIIVEELVLTPNSKTYGFYIPNNTLRKLEWSMDRNPKRNELPTAQKKIERSTITLD